MMAGDEEATRGSRSTWLSSHARSWRLIVRIGVDWAVEQLEAGDVFKAEAIIKAMSGFL